MKNWFMSKSVAVRAAVIVLVLALFVQAGVGAFLLAKFFAPDKKSVASISDSTDTVAEVSVQEEEPAKTVKEPEVEKVVVDKEEDEEETVTLTYYNKSTTKLENGDFSDGLNAWEVYSYVLDNIEYEVDDCFKITMQETGTENWHVQLKQTGIRLEKGKWYTISLDAMSDINRSILCSMQRDGMIHNDDWTPYASEKELKVSSNWKTFTWVFQMPENTDDESVFNIALGAVNGAKITKEHTVSIDNISLTKLPDNWMDALKTGDNLIGNANFEYEDTMWDASVVAPGAANVSFAGNKVTFDITNVGTVDWHVQLKQAGIQLDNNTGYRMTFNVSSSCARTIKLGFMDTEYVNWYGGGDIVLNGTDNQEVTVDFYNSLGTETNALFMLSMGKIDGVATPAGKIAISNLRLVKCSEVGPGAGGGNGGDWTDPNHYLSDGWVAYDHESSHTKYIYESNGTINIDIIDTGSEDWHVQLQNKDTSLVKGNYYKISYEAKSTIPRNIGVTVQKDGSADNDWTPYITGSNVQELKTRWKSFEKTFKMTAKSDNHAIYNFSLGTINGEKITEEHLVSIRNIKIEKVPAPEVPDPVINVGDELLKNPEFTSSSNWESGIYGSAQGNVSFTNGKAIISVSNPGTETWNIQLKQEGIKLEKGAKYEVTLEGTSTAERSINVDFLDASNNWYGGTSFVLTPELVPNAAGADRLDPNVHKFTFTMGGETDKQAVFTISMGKIGATPKSTITIERVSVVKLEEPADPVDTTEVTLEVDPENTAQYKGTLVEFDDLSEFVPDYRGKDVKVSVKIVATGYFGGVIGGMSDGSWKNSDQFSAGSAGTYTWSYVIKKASGGAKVDIYWSQKQKIEYYDLKFEVVEDGEDPENPEEEPWVVDVVDNQVNVEIPDEKYNLSALYGKTVKITAVLEGDGDFKGAIGGGSNGDPDWVAGTESAFAASHTWEVTIPEFKSYAQIQVYWATTATKITIKSVTVEEITAPTGAAEAIVVKSDAAEKNEKTAAEEVEAVVEAEEKENEEETAEEPDAP